MQKSQATADEAREEVGPRIFAFVRGILQLGQDELKQKVSPFCFAIETAPVGLVKPSFNFGTFVSINVTFPSCALASSFFETGVWIHFVDENPAVSAALDAEADPMPLDGVLPAALFFIPRPPPARFIVIVDRRVGAPNVEKAPALLANDRTERSKKEVFMISFGVDY